MYNNECWSEKDCVEAVTLTRRPLCHGVACWRTFVEEVVTR